MTHRYAFVAALLVVICCLPASAQQNEKTTMRTAKPVMYQANIVGKSTLRLEPIGRDPAAVLSKITFKEGSELFGAVIKALEAKTSVMRPIGPDPAGPLGPPRPRPGPGPDPIDPPTVVILKDPLGILTGKQVLPWKLLNPAGACVCKTECAKTDGGTQCIIICRGTGPGCE